MPRKLVSDELWSQIEPLLPKHKPRPKGGRLHIPDRAALTGIIFVLKTGIPWEDLPQEMGCGSGRDTVGRPATGDGLRQWYDLLAQTSGLAGSWCLGKPSPCHPAKFTRYEKDRLEQSLY